jgi:hypothetical protein
MHLLIPFAAPLSEAGRQAAAKLVLPRLQAALARLPVLERDAGDELSLTPPHERALARALGLQGGDGRLPWAAWLAQADGIATGDLAWGLLTPAHWRLGTEQVSLLDPAELGLDEASSRGLFDAVADLFTSQDWLLRYGAPLRWYVAHESLAALPCASLDRVIGRNVDAWLGSEAAARPVRRLQSEAQMRLHTHPINVQREAEGLPTVNSFWLSGCGAAQATHGPLPQLDERLRRPALAEDWAAWTHAWQALDAGPVAELLAATGRGDEATLTLCGERAGARCRAARPGLGPRLRALWSRPALQPLLESL